MDPEIANNGMGVAHLLSQNTGVGLLPFILLVLMSLGTCYYTLLKIVLGQRERRLNAQFVTRFWQHESVQDMERQLAHLPPQEAYGRVTSTALATVAQLNRAGERTVSLKLGSPDEFLLRALRQAITHERVRLERGLAFLASVGSAAPFIGLFGTVWGIYHALLAIGAAGQSSLDKVAGPVGEALIMTGFGLAVALPAVLVYNFFVRRNRLKLAALEAFAYDLFALLVTGFEQSATNVTQLAERETKEGRR
ncbi:MotA/TolQ/ExbB proton channel family protein [Aeromonas salmonicida]|uniref:Biopolymer transport protein ExbB n=1 Tax=Escherichia coli TaxID=562 RepID=A0A3L0VSQ6_ECOLX|nr:MotA/TolQ/ExbB proton channel family protein [Aeromonas salmonicida]MDR6993548.1 biopolymer transport protein ExbB [Aeromonas salmonicida]HEH9413159.1 MotA/TolQ/ExbB proton channel family protein [Aeromonas salmonicida]HEH9422166.1 MotA/TolQ/ExbB proton channel family protein [Aeromonas salmonicida]HEH9435225.1 MotA/TolQ/ExbB proton channel family protein [Aeromonas salmonicida]